MGIKVLAFESDLWGLKFAFIDSKTNAACIFITEVLCLRERMFAIVCQSQTSQNKSVANICGFTVQYMYLKISLNNVEFSLSLSDLGLF